MAYLLDARDYQQPERLEAVKSVLDEVWASEIDFHEDPAFQFRIRIDTLGPISVTRTTSNGLRLRLAPRRAAMDGAPALAVMMHQGATSHFEQAGLRRCLGDGDLVTNDLSHPYSFEWMGQARSEAVIVDVDQLALPVDSIRAATHAKLQDTPMHRLVSNHLRYLLDNVDALSRDPASDVIGQATAELLRAWVAQQTPDAEFARAALHDSELARILEYVRQHIREDDLTGERVAAATFVSTRHLYTLCRRAGISLASRIMQMKLEGARRDLADRALAGRSIATIAASWGFANAAHFGRRFKDEYGLTPLEWRRLHRGSAAGAGRPCSVTPLHRRVAGR